MSEPMRLSRARAGSSTENAMRSSNKTKSVSTTTRRVLGEITNTPTRRRTGAGKPSDKTKRRSVGFASTPTKHVVSGSVVSSDSSDPKTVRVVTPHPRKPLLVAARVSGAPVSPRVGRKGVATPTTSGSRASSISPRQRVSPTSTTLASMDSFASGSSIDDAPIISCIYSTTVLLGERLLVLVDTSSLIAELDQLERLVEQFRSVALILPERVLHDLDFLATSNDPHLQKLAAAALESITRLSRERGAHDFANDTDLRECDASLVLIHRPDEACDVAESIAELSHGLAADRLAFVCADEQLLQHVRQESHGSVPGASSANLVSALESNWYFRAEH